MSALGSRNATALVGGNPTPQATGRNVMPVKRRGMGRMLEDWNQIDSYGVCVAPHEGETA